MIPGPSDILVGQSNASTTALYLFNDVADRCYPGAFAWAAGFSADKAPRYHDNGNTISDRLPKTVNSARGSW